MTDPIRENPYKPPEAKIETTGGYNFSFNIDGIEIKAGGSSFSGKEYVYVNNELISETRTRKMNSGHEFTHNNINYKIEFEVINFLKGHIAFRIYRNDTLTKLYIAAPQINDPVIAIGVMIYALAFLFGTEHMDLPWWAFWVALTPSVPVIMYHGLKHIEIRELEITE